MAATVLSSARAVAVSVFVVRAFLKLRKVFDTLRELMTPPAQPDPPVPPKRPIGFITPEDRPQPKASKGVAPVKVGRNK
jgi:hypothetical protein